MRYGLGVIVEQTPLGTSFGHAGNMPGYRTLMTYFPQYRFAVAVQFNTSDPSKAGGETLHQCLMSLAQVLRH